jgi:hypothetical protein
MLRYFYRGAVHGLTLGTLGCGIIAAGLYAPFRSDAGAPGAAKAATDALLQRHAQKVLPIVSAQPDEEQSFEVLVCAPTGELRPWTINRPLHQTESHEDKQMRGHLYLMAAAVAALAGSGGLVAARAGQPADQPIVLAATTDDTIDGINLVGKTVVDSQAKTLGSIDGVLVDAAGKVKFVVVGVGGFLGIGEKDVALRWDQLDVQSGDRLVANLTKEQLTAMPGYRFADTRRRGSVYSLDQGLANNPYLADQQSMGPAPTANQAAATNSSTSEKPPLPGANSFTESQAKSRIEESGFVGVSSLKKDDQGIWRGTAMKDGKTVNISLDYKGNVVAQ